MYDLVIREGTVVSSHGAITTDIGIFGEKIVALGNGLDGKEVVDATGKYVLPGVIDSHVHFSSPCGGATTSDDFYSGSAAGACGGVTTFLASTVGASDRTLGEDLTSRLAEASPSVTDYGFHSEVVGWKNGRGEEISEVMARGVKSFKFYTTYGAAGK